MTRWLLLATLVGLAAASLDVQESRNLAGLAGSVEQHTVLAAQHEAATDIAAVSRRQLLQAENQEKLERLRVLLQEKLSPTTSESTKTVRQARRRLQGPANTLYSTQCLYQPPPLPPSDGSGDAAANVTADSDPSTPAAVALNTSASEASSSRRSLLYQMRPQPVGMRGLQRCKLVPTVEEHPSPGFPPSSTFLMSLFMRRTHPGPTAPVTSTQRLSLQSPFQSPRRTLRPCCCAPDSRPGSARLSHGGTGETRALLRGADLPVGAQLLITYHSLPHCPGVARTGIPRTTASGRWDERPCSQKVGAPQLRQPGPGPGLHLSSPSPCCAG
jgi:hypothetical protein